MEKALIPSILIEKIRGAFVKGVEKAFSKSNKGLQISLNSLKGIMSLVIFSIHEKDIETFQQGLQGLYMLRIYSKIIRSTYIRESLLLSGEDLLIPREKEILLRYCQIDSEVNKRIAEIQTGVKNEDNIHFIASLLSSLASYIVHLSGLLKWKKLIKIKIGKREEYFDYYPLIIEEIDNALNRIKEFILCYSEMSETAATFSQKEALYQFRFISKKAAQLTIEPILFKVKNSLMEIFNDSLKIGDLYLIRCTLLEIWIFGSILLQFYKDKRHNVYFKFLIEPVINLFKQLDEEAVNKILSEAKKIIQEEGPTLIDPNQLKKFLLK